MSDIHSNLPAIEAVLRHLGRIEGAADCSCAAPHAAVDAIWCLGDTVGYNAHPAECLQLVREHADRVLLGNHDWAALTGDVEGFNAYAASGVAYARQKLTPKDMDYLQSLRPLDRVSLSPQSAISSPVPSDRPASGAADRSAKARPNGSAKEALLCHASPDDPLWEYLDRARAERFVDREGAPALVAFGHTHVPFILAGKNGHRVVNAGSVGQPRDGDPRACLVTVDTERMDVMLHRVAYDVAAAANAVKSVGLPTPLGDRLFMGR